MSSRSIRTIASMLFLSLVVVAGHLIPGLNSFDVEDGIRNALHILVFAIFSVSVFHISRHLGTTRAIVVALLVVLVVAAVSEFIQYTIGKRPDPIDIGRDLAGAVLALLSTILWRWSSNNNNSSATRHIKRSMSAMFGLLIIVPMLYWFSVIAFDRAAFPTILSFDGWWEKHLYRAVNAEMNIRPADSGGSPAFNAVAEIQLSGWGRSGIQILPTVSDWADYGYLTFSARMINSPSTTVTVRVNDHDRLQHYADRFIATITVTDEYQLFHLSIREMTDAPGHRSIDLTSIREIVIFARDKRDGSIMLLDNVRLQKLSD